VRLGSLPVKSHSIGFRKRFEILRSTSGPISLPPLSYRESWPWLIPSSRARSFCVMSNPRSSRRRRPTLFQSITENFLLSIRFITNHKCYVRRMAGFVSLITEAGVDGQ
jgi:hypothetical protein